MPRAVESANENPRILLTGWAGAGNIGDELLTEEVVAQVRAGGAVPVVASRSPEATAALHGVESVPWGPKGRAALSEVNGVCIGPGGILQDSSSLWSLPGHLFVPALAARRGIPLAAIGVGVEPIRRRSSRWLLRRVLAGRPVVTRDQASTDALAAVGINASTGVDVVFGRDLPTVERRNEILVSVGGSVAPGLVSPARRRIRPAQTAEIVEAVDLLADRLDASVVLARFRGERDASAAQAIAGRLHARSEVLPDDVGEHVRRVCGSRLVVSSRYHPLVLAARAGVPSIAVSGQDKVRSLVGQVGEPLARLHESWREVGSAEIAEITAAAAPPEVAVARDAIADLLSAARAPRSGGSRD